MQPQDVSSIAKWMELKYTSLTSYPFSSVSSGLIQPRSDQEKKVEVSRNLSSSVRHKFMFKGKLQYASQLSLLFTAMLLQCIKVHHSYLSACYYAIIEH